jgi:hypothetical protein
MLLRSWAQNIDLSSVSTISFSVYSSQATTRKFAVYIDDELVLDVSTFAQSTWVPYTIDVSSYTGICEFKMTNKNANNNYFYSDDYSALTDLGVPISNSFSCNLEGYSESRSTSGTVQWEMTPNNEATQLLIESASSDYDYLVEVTVIDSDIELSSFTTAQENIIHGINSSMGMSGTIAVVIVSISVIFLVMRLVA